MKIAEDAEDAEKREEILVDEKFKNSSVYSVPPLVVIRIVTLALLVFAAAAAHASQGPCSAEQGRLAQAEAVTLQDWDAVYQSYQQYENCDDGPVAAEYSKSVARILLGRWESLPRLSELARDHEDFKAFALKHVDKTLNKEDLKKIEENAKTRCPAGLRDLCDDLKKQGH